MNEVVQPINNGEKPVSKHELNRTEALALENMELMALNSYKTMRHAKRHKKDTIKYAKVSLRKIYGIILGESVLRIEYPNGVFFYFAPAKVKFKAENNGNNVVLYLKGTVYDPAYEEPYTQLAEIRGVIEYGEIIPYNEDDIPTLLEIRKLK